MGAPENPLDSHVSGQSNKPMTKPAHALKWQQVAEELKADAEDGLKSPEAKTRLEEYGRNELGDTGGVNPGKILVRQVANAMTLVLIMAMAVSFGIRSWIEGGVVAGVIGINIVVGFTQEFQAEKTMDSLRSLSSPTAVAVRDGKAESISTQEIVPGDLVELKTGDTIPADIRVIEAVNFETDEALLTGESLPVRKAADDLFEDKTGPGDRLNVAYSSSTVTKGRATGIVFATGMFTEIGTIAAALRKKDSRRREPKKRDDGTVKAHRWLQAILLTGTDFIGHFLGVNVGTPLQKKLSRLAVLLFFIAVICAIICLAANDFSNRQDVIIYAVVLLPNFRLKKKKENRFQIMLNWILCWSLITLPLATILLLASQILNHRRNKKRAVGFFHPYTNDGGGGERVLWCAVKAIQEQNPDLDSVIFSGDNDASSQSLMSRATDRFGVHLLYPPKVVHLNRRKWIEETTYPHFTMIGQSLGSVYLSWEALNKFTPLYYFDTSGYAFTYPIARLFGCKVICYTHYPTISLDMVSRVRQRSSMYNNDAVIAKSMWLSRCKIIYYRVFSVMYGMVGSCAHLVMVNSSWTQSHIEKLWGIPKRIKRVYPPCDTSGLQALPLERSVETPKIISVAQFRPEKAHSLQLEAFSVAIKKLEHYRRPKLQFVGSCRNKSDEERLQNLKDKAVQLNIQDDVEFHKNVMYRDLVSLLGGAVAGIHSMIDEHFGISVVEYMAAGAIPIAHNSAGPKMDIVLDEDRQQTGFLAQNVEEYADAVLKIVKMPESERLMIATAARRRASRFSEQRFYDDLKAAIRPIICGSS